MSMTTNGNQQKVSDRRAEAGLTVFRYRSKSCTSQMLTTTSSTTNNLSNASSFSNHTNSSSSSSGMTKASLQNNIGAILLQKHSVQEAAERFHAAILTATMDNTNDHNHGVPIEHQHPHQNGEESWFRLRNHQQAEEEEIDETMKQFPLPQRPACKLVQVDSSGLDWFYNKLKREQQHGGAGGGTGADSSTQQTNHNAGQNNNSYKAPIVAHDASKRTTYPSRNNEASTTNTATSSSTAGGFQSGNDYLEYKANALDTLERRIPLGLEFITQPIHIPSSSTATNKRTPPPPPLYKRNCNFKEQEGDSGEEEEDGVEESPYLDRNAICAAFLNLARIRLEYDYTGSVKYERKNHNTQQQPPTTQKGLERNSMKDILMLCLASIDPPISSHSNTPTQSSSKQSTLSSSSTSSSTDHHIVPVRPLLRGKMNRSQSVHISSSSRPSSSSHATNDIFCKTNHKKSQKQPRDLSSLHHNTQHQRQQHHKPKRKKQKQQKLLPSLEIIARNNIGVLKFAQNRMNEAKHEFELAYNILSKVQSSSSSSFSTSITTSNQSKPPPTRPHLKRCSSIDESCTTQEHSESDCNGDHDENDEEALELVPVLPYDYLYITTLINLSRTCIQIKDIQRAQELLDRIDSLPSSLTMMLPLVSSSSSSPSPDQSHQSISASLFSPPSPGRLMRSSSTSSPWQKRSSITNNVTNTTNSSFSHYHHHILNQRYKYLHSTLSKNYHHALLNQQQEHFQLALEHYNAMIYACREDHHLGGTTNSWRNGTARRNSLCGNNHQHHNNNNHHNYHHHHQERNNRHHNSLYVSILLEKKGNVLFDMGKLGQAMLSYLACLKVYEFEERELNQLTPSHMRMTNVTTNGDTNNINHSRNHHQHYYAIEKSRILYAIGRTHHDRVEYPDALTVYQKALTYLPTSSSSAIEILTNVGRLHRNMGNLELALETNLQIVNLATAIIVGKHIAAAGRSSSTDEVSSSNDSHDDIALQHAFVRNRLVALGNLYVESGRLNDAMDVFARVERFRSRANLDQVSNSYYTEEEEEDVDTNALAVKAAKRLGKASSRKMKPHAAAA